MSRTPARHDAVDARRPSERGAALVFALFGLATLTSWVWGLTSIGMSATKMTSNEQRHAASASPSPMPAWPMPGS